MSVSSANPNYNSLNIMMTYISIIRGINVTGNKLLKMDDLRKMYEGLHFKNVRTYIQSGNVIFQHDSSELKELEGKISAEIKNHFGYDVAVMVLKTGELADIIHRNPLKNDPTRDIAFMHVTILSSDPGPVNLEFINSKKAPGEELFLAGRAIYLYCPYGYGKTRLNNNFLESRLKVKATTRTWKTALELLRIAESNIHFPIS